MILVVDVVVGVDVLVRATVALAVPDEFGAGMRVGLVSVTAGGWGCMLEDGNIQEDGV